MKQLKGPLLLASKSPRRQELMKKAGYDFEVKTIEVEESFPDSLPSHQVAEYLASKKSNVYLKKFKEHIIITADTTVVIDDLVLNKPENHDEALEMLQMLSGRSHEVITGVCICYQDAQLVFSDSTLVTFKQLKEEEILYYINNFKPYDKAGAYGIQEWIGMIGIKRIEGSYYNVMGLPIQKIYEALTKEFTA